MYGYVCVCVAFTVHTCGGLHPDPTFCIWLSYSWHTKIKMWHKWKEIVTQTWNSSIFEFVYHPYIYHFTSNIGNYPP